MFEYYETKITYDKSYKKSCWDAAIGLQEVDNLQVSEYLKELSQLEIEGELSHEEIEELLYDKYVSNEDKANRQKEADIVSSRIASLLKETGFTFSPVTLKYIHKTLFTGIYDHAGEYRNYNISKNEPILGGKTVKYANYQMIEDTFAYDFEQEKRNSYKGLYHEFVTKRLADFSSSIWQVHPFTEGNTRTTAVFMQKYLLYMGFEVDNTLFAKNSMYYRNALVRSNYADYMNGIMPTTKYLEMFYQNLLFDGKHELKNRELIIKEYVPKIKEKIHLAPK